MPLLLCKALKHLTRFGAQLPQTLEEAAMAIARVEKSIEAEQQEVCARALEFFSRHNCANASPPLPPPSSPPNST